MNKLKMDNQLSPLTLDAFYYFLKTNLAGLKSERFSVFWISSVSSLSSESLQVTNGGVHGVR